MKKTITVELQPERLKLLQEILAYVNLYPDAGPHEILDTITVPFGDKIEADIKVVNSNSGPYVDPVLFHDGCEVTCLEVAETIEGEYVFTYDGNQYEVIIK